MKNNQKTHKCPKKKQTTVIQPEDLNELEIGSVPQNGCSEKVKKISRKTAMVITFFLILLTKTLHQGCVLCNFLKYFKAPQDSFF